MLVQGAQTAGFADDLWSGPRIAQLIASIFGIRYHVDHIGRLLRTLGWSMPELNEFVAKRTKEEDRDLKSATGLKRNQITFVAPAFVHPPPSSGVGALVGGS